MTNKPLPQIIYRKMDDAYYQAACEAGYDPLAAQIVASRPISQTVPIESIFAPKLKFLDHPEKLPDLDIACERLYKAIENQEIIGIETDHDCDGQTSHAVIFTALTECFGYPENKIRSYIGHRLKEGYGLSEKVMERMLADDPRPSVIITADNGSSDEARIAILQSQGIDVIVTDHHEIPIEGIPQSAFAVINPIRHDSTYPDKAIAGCMVAWLVMAALRQKIMQHRQITLPSLANILDFVAVGTIADCVSMAKSQNNRAVVAYGMKLIEQGKRPCWQVLKPLLSQPLSSEDLGFKIGPLLNSDGRLACAFGSVSFLLAKTLEEASKWVTHLQAQNQERKSIQDKLSQAALLQAKQQYAQGRQSLCIFLEDGHAGVHGICASRVKEAFGRPVIIFSPKEAEPGCIAGSGRSIEGLHLREVLQEIQNAESLIERFGGHQGAVGLSLLKENFERFSECFETMVRKRIDERSLGPKIFVDQNK
jgi:single-stranded-DNA-specific exonuclease